MHGLKVTAILMTQIGIMACIHLKPHFRVDWRLLVEEGIANTGIPLDDFAASKIFYVLKYFRAFGSLQTSLLSKVGKFTGGGSLDVSVLVSDR